MSNLVTINQYITDIHVYFMPVQKDPTERHKLRVNSMDAKRP